MTGYESKKAAAQAKVEGPIHVVCQCDKCKAQPAQEKYIYGTPLLDAMTQNYVPPKRPWVGLTDEEKDGKRVLENGLLFNAAEVQAWELGIDYAESKLKGRNA